MTVACMPIKLGSLMLMMMLPGFKSVWDMCWLCKAFTACSSVIDPLMACPQGTGFLAVHVSQNKQNLDCQAVSAKELVATHSS